MTNIYGKRLALLHIMDYLLNYSDEKHPVKIKDISKMLEDNGTAVERKTIYSAIELLRDGYGIDIISEHGKYFVGSRTFDLEEIKILVDMVQSSNAITLKKTEQLLKKLEGQVSSYEAKELQRKIYVRNRVKSNNESVYINIDKISEAISNDNQINFQYYSYNVSKEKELKHNGKIHLVSPFALVWVDQNYYLVAYDSENVELRHYRVDRMVNINIVEEQREGKKLFERTDMSTYTNKSFYMFTGEETKVTLRCKNYIVDSIIDRFGYDSLIIPDGNDYFTITVNVLVSPQFFAWLSPFGSNIEVVRPQSVRKQLYDHISEIAKLYEHDND